MKVLLFDFFGVLCAPTYYPIIQELLPRVDHDIWLAKLEPLDLGELSETELVAQMSKASGISEADIWERVRARVDINIELLDYIATELKPRVRVGLFTNVTRTILDRQLGKYLPLFDPQIVSSELKLAKPDPQIFKTAIKMCGEPASDVVFVDDSPINVEAAKKAGMQSFIYTDFPGFKKHIDTYL